ncbi:MAG: hypothetical protein OXF74_10795 [Rhodobacteraceae bacterium]|nr:hypothetical protein [Paracoccaceae bacterium]
MSSLELEAFVSDAGTAVRIAGHSAPDLNNWLRELGLNLGLPVSYLTSTA